MSTKCHAHERCGTLRKSSFSTRGYAEIHIQRPFFDNKNSIWKILRLKIQMVKLCTSASSLHRKFYFWKKLKSRFLVEFQSFVVRQILAVLGSFGQKLLHSQWLRACPHWGWNLHETSHWKAIIHRYSLKESQNPHLLHVVMGACPKSEKAVLAASGL